MTSSAKSEENFPLLLLFVEDDKVPHKKNGVFVEKNRYSKISEGAGYVFTQWPEHISSSWISGCLFLLFFLVLILVIIAASIRPIINPTCLTTSENISNPGIYLVVIGEDLDEPAVEEMEEIIRNYPNFRIEIFFLKHYLKVKRIDHNIKKRSAILLPFHSNKNHNISSTNTTVGKKNSTQDLDKNYKISSLNINVGRKDILKNMTFNPFKFIDVPRNTVTLSELIKRYKIDVFHRSIREFFAFTQLHNGWKRLSDDLLEFAARVVLLWENGGISFKLIKGKLNNTKIQVYKTSNILRSFLDEEWKIKTFIQSNLSSFQQLPLGIVNIDDRGLHMETKTPCHAYFGDMLSNLKHANKNSTIESIIRVTLKSFCLSGAVNDEYCLQFFKRPYI